MKVSILMAAYTGIEFLAESVASVESQSEREWELLIGVNGYPGDHEVVKYACSFANRRVNVLHCSNFPGKSAALNHMAAIAQAKLLAVLDVDDLWHPEKLTRQLPYLERYDVVGTNCEYFGDRTGTPGLQLGEVPGMLFLDTNHIVNSSVVFHRDDAGWDSAWEIEDYEMWLRLAATNRRFFNIPDVLCWHRVHAGSAFNTRQHPVGELRKRWQAITDADGVRGDRPYISY